MEAASSCQVLTVFGEQSDQPCLFASGVPLQRLLAGSYVHQNYVFTNEILAF